MDDDKINPEENQSGPETLFETVPVEQSQPESSNQNLQPEEVAPELVAPEDVTEQVPPPEGAPPGQPPQGSPPFVENNRNKYLIIGGGALLFLIIFILILKFIFGSGTPAKEVNLVYWGLWEDKNIMQPLIDQYQAKNRGVKIDYIKLDPQDYREKLIARSKNNQGPDIFRFHNTWLPEIKDVAAPLPSSVMSNEEFDKTFYPIQSKDLKRDSFYYGIPLTIDGLVLIYNEGLFKKAGINNPPLTWEDVIDYVGKLTVKNQDGQIITSGMALGTASNVDHFSDIFGLFLIQNGGDLKKLDQPEAAGALESFRKFAEPPNNFWNETLPNSVNAFIQEKVAMIIVPSWEILTIKAANPEIGLKVVPVPEIPGGRPVSIASYWVEGVSKMSRNQVEAWKFLRYLSEKDNMAKLYDLESKARLFGEPYSRVDLGTTLAQNEYLGAVIKQAGSYVTIPTIARTYDNGLNDEINTYIQNAINSTIQGTSYSDALKTAQQGVSQVFSKYQIQ